MYFIMDPDKPHEPRPGAQGSISVENQLYHVTRCAIFSPHPLKSCRLLMQYEGERDLDAND